MESKFELTKEIVKDILEQKSEKFTLEEIEQLMKYEVEKPEEEMDTELVDMCASILAKAYNPDFKDEMPDKMFRPWEKETASATVTATPEKPKKKVIPFKRVLIIAAAMVIIFAVAIPAGAQLFGKSDSDGIIGFYKDFFRINVRDENTTQNEEDWINQLILENLHTRMLPQALLDEKYEKKPSVKQDEDKTVTFINLANKETQVSGTIIITEYKNKNANTVNGQVNVSDKHRNFKQLLVAGKEIIVFGRDDTSYINYSDGTTNYEISLGCDFDTMVSIAETINVKG